MPLLDHHQRRVDRSRRWYYAKSPAFRLSEVLRQLELPTSGLFKLRILYGAQLLSYEVLPYALKPVNSLRIVHADALSYGRKYADREGIDNLFDKRRNCDDILIIQRGYLTDTSYANIALSDGERWYTPSWPLLRGARRELLVEQKVIHPSVIRLRDLGHFVSLRLVNSMMEWEEGPTVRTTAILHQ